MAVEYPKREAFFAHKHFRLMAKTCAAQDIGPEAMLLCGIIAHTEDSKRYTGPVLYWNEQLAAVCGFGSIKRLVNARKKAVESGWLHYEKGARARAPRYWVTVPPNFESLPDGPCDEDVREYCDEKNGETPVNKDENNGLMPDRMAKRPSIRHSIRHQSGINRASLGHTFLPSPKPSPSPKDLVSADADASDEPAVVDVELDIERELVAMWNSAKGVKHCRGSTLTAARRRQLRARLKDKMWDWRVAIAMFPLPVQRGSPGSWEPTIDWFLKPDSVQKILEGKYDFTKANDNRRSRAIGRGESFDRSTAGEQVEL